MKKQIFLLLSLLLCFFVLASCSNDSEDTEHPGKPAIPPEERVVFMQNDTPDYQVIRSDVIAGGSFETQAAIRIVNDLKELTGIEPPLYTDYSGKGGYEELTYEILVGTTARNASATAAEMLGKQDYLICVIDTKICILGQNEYFLNIAIDRFFNEYLYYEDGAMYVSKSLNVCEKHVLPEGTFFEVTAAGGAGMDKYDHSVALACLQGIMNRESPNKVYLNENSETADWFSVFREEGRWLSDKSFITVKGFDELLTFGSDYVKAVVLWDENVPATLNVACTVAGVEDGIVMSERMYRNYKEKLADKKLISLVGQFDGSETGSAKNDAYRWAIRNYLDKGLCSTEYICSYIDGWSFRERGNVSYTVVRDWGIYHRAFVFDLSPWGDEAPLDDPDQPIGTDKETLLMIFDTMLMLTEDLGPYEVCGFFEHQKYSQAGNNAASIHGSVKTEWEYASLMTPYNGYHNTCIDAAWNESFHTLYTGAEQLRANRPTEEIELEPGVVYLCFFMGDYDSTHPVYRYLKQAWDDPRRGEIPFAWAINPNLIETYPDLIGYYYDTATPNDYFVSDASAAGYFMPSQVPDSLWPNLLEHNIKYFNRADMTIAPMVLDRTGMDESDLEMMVQIAPDGIGTVLQNKCYMYGDTPVAALLGGGYDRTDSTVGAKNLQNVVETQFKRSKSGASLNLLRCVWSTPTVMCETVELYQEANPDKEVVVVDIYNYFKLMEQDLNWK